MYKVRPITVDNSLCRYSESPGSSQTAHGAAHGAPRRADPTLATLRLVWPGIRISPTLIDVSSLETPHSGPTNL